MAERQIDYAQAGQSYSGGYSRNPGREFQKGRSKRGGAPSQVDQILARFLKNQDLERKIARYRFVSHWKEIVGEDIAKRSRPEFIKNGTLMVLVSNSAWAQELSFQKKTILMRLKRFINSNEIVSDVSFRVGGDLPW